MPKNTFFNLPEKRRQEIVDKATEYYISNPYDQISIRSLADHLNMPIGTFYRYFNDKDELFLYIAEILDEKYERDENFILTPEYKDNNSEYVNSFFTALHKAPENVQRRFHFDTFTKRSIPLHRRELLKMRYKGMLRDDVDIDLVAYLYSTILYNLNMYYSKMGIEDEELRTQIHKYLFYGFFMHGIMKPESGGEL